jgi:acyl-CoA thioesterase-1
MPDQVLNCTQKVLPMNPFVVHVANGQVFFTAVILIVSGLLLKERIPLRRLPVFVCLTGLLFVAISSVPFPAAIVALNLVLTVFALMKGRPKLRRIVCLVWIVGAVLELPLQITPLLPQSLADAMPPVVVLADSVTAGLGEGVATSWQLLLASSSQLQVLDYSHVGETARSALKRAADRGVPDSAVVVLEIGGNDILGGTSLEQFQRDLRELLAYLHQRNCHVYMFELPLPPFHAGWGRAQRDLAHEFDVALIPKHQLASVFVGDHATLDSIHLSQTGHNRMLKIVRYVLRLKPNDG